MQIIVARVSSRVFVGLPLCMYPYYDPFLKPSLLTYVLHIRPESRLPWSRYQSHISGGQNKRMAGIRTTYLETVSFYHPYFYECRNLTLDSSFVARFVTESKLGLKKGEGFFGPILRERSSKMDELGGEWRDKPVGVVQMWLVMVVDEHPRKIYCNGLLKQHSKEKTLWKVSSDQSSS